MRQERIKTEFVVSRVSCIYKLTNLTSGKVYIGSTKDLLDRSWEHWNKLVKGTHTNPMLLKSFNRGDNFKLEVLEECKEMDLISREEYYIGLHNSMNRQFGYNICKPGYRGGRKLTKKDIERLAQARRQKNSLKGRRQSVDHIERARVGKYKKVDVFDANMNYLFTTRSLIEAEEKTGVFRQNISQGCRMQKYIFKGYTFRYNKD